MRFALLLFFIALPLLELALLIKLGQRFGFWPTISLVVGTALLGLAILQYQGLTAIRRGMKNFADGEPPVAAVMDTAMLIFAGLLLIAPGPITDCVGLIFLIPPLRTLIGEWLLKRMAGEAMGWPFGGEGQRRSSAQPSEDADPRKSNAPGRGPVIEGEFERIDEKPVNPNRDPGPSQR